VAGRMVVEIRGVDSLRDRLRMMRSHVREGTEAAAREAGRMGEATMKGLAPVDTGRLRDSIRHEVRGPTVRFGPGDEIDYAASSSSAHRGWLRSRMCGRRWRRCVVSGLTWWPST